MDRSNALLRLGSLLVAAFAVAGCADREPVSPTSVTDRPSFNVTDGSNPIPLGVGIAHAINNRGQIAGWLKADETCEVPSEEVCEYRAVLWEDETVTDLGARLYRVDVPDDPSDPFKPPLNASNVAPMGLNERGDVVGSHMPGPGAPYHAFWWHDGTLESLGVGHAYDINERGQITLMLGEAPDFEAVIWEDGDLTPVVGDLGGNFIVPRAINNREQVAGFSLFADLRQNPVRRFLWEDGVMQDLGFQGGAGLEGGAYDINERGQIVGFTGTPGETIKGYLWEKGEFTDLGYLCVEETFAFGINRRGQVVGVTEDCGGPVPFVWEKGEMRLLPGGVDHFALDINDRGQVVGYTCDGGCTGGTQVTALLWDVDR